MPANGRWDLIRRLKFKVYTVLKTTFFWGHCIIYNAENKITERFVRHDGLIDENKNMLHYYMFRLYSKAIFRPNTRLLTYTESVQWLTMSYHSYATHKLLP
jgi:hypothetical protein